MPDQEGRPPGDDKPSAVIAMASSDDLSRKIEQITTQASLGASGKIDWLKSLETTTASAALRESLRASSAAEYALQDVLGVSSAIADQEAIARGIQEQFRHSFDGVSAASAALTESLARLPAFEVPRYEPPELPELLSPHVVYPEFDAKPLLSDTNEHLDELNDRLAALVDVAKHQSELTQAISESTQAALTYAIQSGAEAKASATLARTSIELGRASLRLTRWAVGAAIISVVMGILVPIYIDRRGSAAVAVRLEDDRALRRQEIMVLDRISLQLAADAKARSDAATHASVVPPPVMKIATPPKH